MTSAESDFAASSKELRVRVRRFVEEVQDAAAAQRRHLLDLALGDLGERLRAVQDALDARRGPGPRSTADAASGERLLELGDGHLVDAVDLARRGR